MCCFSRPVRYVSQTQIFARSAEEGRQSLVYSMNVALDEDLAMVLPLPTPPGVAEDAVRFIDLSGYPSFFHDLGKGFPDILLAPKRGGFMQSAGGAERPKLRVHDVGQFVASFVPSIRDFERLDERFRMPGGVWEALPVYRDYGFAVFQLRRGGGLLGWLRRMRTFHPMALEFPRRDPGALFFPTVHVHDGTVHAEAQFDHALYCQPDPQIEWLLDWDRSDEPAGAFVNVQKAAGIVAGNGHAYRRTIMGKAPNRDVVLDEPSLRADVALGDHFLLRARAAGASGAWEARTPAERERVKEELVRKLSRLTEERREAWGLVRYRRELPERWPTFYEAFPERASAPPNDAPCRVKFFVWNERVEPQEICMAFTETPSREKRDAITKDLQQALDEAAGA